MQLNPQSNITDRTADISALCLEAGGIVRVELLYASLRYGSGFTRWYISLCVYMLWGSYQVNESYIYFMSTLFVSFGTLGMSGSVLSTPHDGT